MSNNKVELLAPAGDLEKLYTAFSYGADAVYIGGEVFGLRSAAGNFSLSDIDKGVQYAHQRNKKVYLALNNYPYNYELEDLTEYLKSIRSIPIDAIIVSDLGAFSLVQEHTSFPIHVSTQTSTTNSESVKFWMKLGAKRVILAREVSIQEAQQIKVKCNTELEMFIHGSMCMSYSGKCTISNFTANRDANRGGCVNSCRWEYSLCHKYGDEPYTQSYLMNSKDLCAFDLIPDMIESGIESFKIEGRMKSHLYLAHAITAYRKLIDSYLEHGTISEEEKEKWLNLLHSNPTRGFCEGFLTDRAGKESVLYDNSKVPVIEVGDKHCTSSNFIGIVKEVTPKEIVIQVKNCFCVGDTLGFYLFNGEQIPYQVEDIQDITRESISETKPNSIVFLKRDPAIEKYNIVYLSKSV